MIELNRANFKDCVKRNGVVLISCWAPGCGVCDQFEPVFEKVAEANAAHVFARMNVHTDERLGEFFEIEHTPSLMLYREGLLLLKKPGKFSEEALHNMLEQAEALDMERVRQDLDPSTAPQTGK